MEVAKNCKRIRNLQLQECSEVDQTVVSMFLQNCRDLRVLHLSGRRARHLTKESVDTLCRTAAQNITEIRLPWCKLSTNELAHLISSLRNLVTLELSYCNVDDIVVEKIAANCPSLRSLSLHGCKQVSLSVVKVVSECKHLSTLDLSQCSGVPSLVLQMIETQYPHLTLVRSKY